MSQTVNLGQVVWAGGSGDLASDWITGYVENVGTNGVASFVNWVYGAPTSLTEVDFDQSLSELGTTNSSVGSGGTLTGIFNVETINMTNTATYILTGDLTADAYDLAAFLTIEGSTATLDVTNEFIIGDDGNGSLAIADGGAVSMSGEILVAYGSSSDVTVSGIGSTLTSLSLVVGVIGGEGSLTIADGGAVSVSGEIDVGDRSDSGSGTITVSGTASTLTSDILTVGFGASGSLAVLDGAAASASGEVVIGDSGSGMVTVSGIGSTLTQTSGSLVFLVGVGGDGSLTAALTVADAGTVSTIGTMDIGYHSSGTVTLMGGTLDASSIVVYSPGEYGSPTEYYTDGGTISGSGIVDGNVENNGSIVASGGTLAITGSVDGSGVVQIDSNATLELGGSFSSGGTVSFSEAGNETLILDDPTDFSGTITGMVADDTVIAVETSGNFTIDLEFDPNAVGAGMDFMNGIEQAASILVTDIHVNRPITINLQIEYNEDITLPTGGAEAGPQSDTVVPYSTVRTDLIDNAASGDPNFSWLPDTSTIQGQSSVEVWSAEAKALGIIPGSAPGIDGSADFGTGIPSGNLVGVGLHELTHAMGRVPNGGSPDIFDLFRFTSAGTILVDDSLPASAAAYFSVDGGVTKLADYGISSDPSDYLNASPITYELGTDPGSPLTPNDPFDQSYGSNTAQTLTSTDLTQLDVLGFSTFDTACFAEGTLLATLCGPVAVERLRTGDTVRTVLSETDAPIIWIGRRHVDCMHHPKPKQVWPVRVAAGAFGADRPHTDLFLSPDHAVYLNEVLIPVKCLINGSTIAQMPVDHITYYHIELPRHDVVLAQGLPTESFLDIKDGSNYVSRPGPVRLYPDYSARMWEAYGCAPLILAGPELAAARALVAGFALKREAA